MILASILDGGSPRSSEVTTVRNAVEAVQEDPSLFDELFAEIFNDDHRIARRAAKAVEKLTRKNSEPLQPWKRVLLEQVVYTENKHVRWQTALMFGRLKLEPDERDFVLDLLFNWLDGDGSVIRTCSLQGLADLAMQDAQLLPDVLPLLEDAVVSGTPAMRARSRALLKKLARHR